MQSAKKDWDAGDYARNSSAQWQWAHELIEKLALQGHESLLDIGCGDGKITAHLARILETGRVVGLDASPSMIRLASESFPPQRHPNLSFVQMDATDIRILEKFDIAFSNAALHWVGDHPAVLRGVRGCLKPGGRLLFQMGGRGNVAGLFRVVGKIIESSSWRRHFEDFIPPYYMYGPEEYEAWLGRYGFRAGRIELFPKDMQHQGREGLKGWIRTTWFPYTARLPEELREPFLNEILDAYLATSPVDAQGNTHVEMIRLEVEAYAV